MPEGCRASDARFHCRGRSSSGDLGCVGLAESEAAVLASSSMELRAHSLSFDQEGFVSDDVINIPGFSDLPGADGLIRFHRGNRGMLRSDAVSYMKEHPDTGLTF